MNVPATLGTAVLDANGIIGLAKGGALAYLPAVFSVVWVPSAVVAEVTDPVSRAELDAALADWLRPQGPTEASLARVPALSSEADRQVLALGLDHHPCVLVTGDRGLSNRAHQLHLVTISAPGMIQVLATAGVIAAARPYLDRMRAHGFGITDLQYGQILQSLGE